MTRGRLEAFSDGVVAILITIMVLELRPPAGTAFADLAPVVPKLLSYLLSFVYVGIYWNNHHHLMHAVQRVDGRVLWANLHLLFWLSLVPFATAWMGEHGAAPATVAAYAALQLLAAVAYQLLTRALLAIHSSESPLAVALGADWKGKLSLASYAAAVPLAFASRWAALGILVAVAVLWWVPDPRIERTLERERARS
jgi:TMEM175 potassium channel family protein